MLGAIPGSGEVGGFLEPPQALGHLLNVPKGIGAGNYVLLALKKTKPQRSGDLPQIIPFNFQQPPPAEETVYSEWPQEAGPEPGARARLPLTPLLQSLWGRRGGLWAAFSFPLMSQTTSSLGSL